MESLTLSEHRLSREELLLGVGGSVFVHILVVVLAVVLPLAMPAKHVESNFCTVNLVSLKDLGGGAPMAKGDSPRAPEGPKSAEPVKKPAASTAKSSSPVVPVKRLHMDEPVRKVEHEVKKIEPRETPKFTEPTQTASIDKNVDSLIPKPKAAPKPTPITQQAPSSEEKPSGRESAPAAQQTASAGDQRASGQATTRGNPRGTAGGTTRDGVDGTGTSGGGLSTSERYAYYQAIQRAIRQQYVLPPSLKDQKLQAVLVLVLRRDGRIIALNMEKNSGNAMFDESVLRAVRRAEPLPPFPQGSNLPQEEIALKFRPEDLS